MAEQLDSFDFTEPRYVGLYPWDDWLNGKPWRLIPGKDFRVKDASFQTNAGMVAKRRGGHIRSQTIAGGVIVIQFFEGPRSKKGGVTDHADH